MKKINLDKTSTAFSIFAAFSTLGCPICFSAVAGIASALGLGFLGRYEGVFVILFQVFTVLSVISIVYTYKIHGKLFAPILSIISVLLIFLSMYEIIPFYELVYVGIVLLIIASILNYYISKKCSKNCSTSCENGK